MLGTAPETVAFSHSTSFLPHLQSLLVLQVTGLPTLVGKLAPLQEAAGGVLRTGQLIFPAAYPRDKEEASMPPGLVCCTSHPPASALTQCGRGLSKDRIPLATTNSINTMGPSISFQTTNVGTWDTVQSVECWPSTHEILHSASALNKSECGGALV